MLSLSGRKKIEKWGAEQLKTQLPEVLRGAVAVRWMEEDLSEWVGVVICRRSDREGGS